MGQVSPKQIKAFFDVHSQVAKENGQEHDCKVRHIFQWMRQSIDDHVQALIGLEGPKACRRFVMQVDDP